jgi:Domain of unknown function (DUF397)
VEGPAVNPSWRKSSYSNGGTANCVEVGAWRKSSYSNGGSANCVEVGAWRKSSYSNGGSDNCVEVGSPATSSAVTGVLVRDTTDRAGAALTVPAAAWRALLTDLRG